jgi:tubulin monoglycylase TTLL3/8
MEKLSQRVVQEALERRGQSGVSGPIDSEGGASDQENGALSKPKKRVTPEAAEALVARLQARAQRTADGIALMANAPPPARDFVDWKRKHNLELDCPVFCMTGWYPCVKDALIQRGWFYNPDALSPFFDLKWTLRSSDIGLDSLQPWQLTNHFLKNIAITTKAGLIKCLQQLVWHADVCPDDIIPRAYDLSSLLELHAFVADFRYQKAQNVLKTLYFRISGSKGPLYKRDAKSRSNRTQSGSGHSFDQGDDTDNPNKKSDVSPRDAELSKMMEGGFGKLDFERPGSSRGGDMAGRPLTASSIADSIPLPPPSGASPESFMVNKAVFEVACDVLERYLRPQEDSYLDAPEEDADDIPMTPLEWEVLVYHAIDAPSRSGLAASAPELLGPFGNTLEEEEGGAGHSLRDSRAASTKYNGSLHRSRKKQKRNDAAARAAMNDAVKQMVPLTNQGYQRIHRLLCRLYVLEGNQAGLNGNCASSQNLWIVKPAAKSRGRGITTFSDLDKLLTYVDAAQTGQGSGSGGASMWIVQKYMENPLIIANRKFDLRQWVLVTDWNPLTIYFFDECYARFSVEEYSTDSASLENAFVHLVNNSIGKNSDKFGVTVTAENGEPISGYMWDFNQFKDYVKFRSGGVDYVTEKIHPRMKEIAKWSLSCAVDMIEHRKNSWELYGFDFMVDDNYNAWLIEINSSPACDYSTKTTERYVQKALVELLAVTLDVRKWEAAPRKDRGERPDTGGWECIYKGPLLETAASSFGMDMTIKGSGVKLPRRGPAFVGASQSHSIAPASDKAGAASSPGRESSGAGAAARSEPTRTTAPRPILRHASTGPLASAKMGTFSGDAAPLDIDGGNDDNMGATRSAHSKNKRLTTSDVMPAASGDGAADRNEFDDSDEDELGDIGSKRLAGRIAKTRSSGMSDRSARQTPSASTTTAAAVASSRAGGASLSGTTTSHTTAAAAAGNPHTKRGEVAIPVKVFSVDF